MAYEWIVRIASFAEVTVLTGGSRLSAACGLENRENIKLEIIPIRWRGRGTLETAVKLGYVEYFWRARKRIRSLISSRQYCLGHHIQPRSTRYPVPFVGLGLPYIIGPIHGGLAPPPVMRSLQIRESPIYVFRSVDRLRALHDPLLRKSFADSRVTLVSAPYVKNVAPVSLCKDVCILPGSGVDFRAPSSSAEVRDEKGNCEKKLRLVYAGRLVPSKGLELVLRAMAELRDMRITLSVYGTGHAMVAYQQLVTALGIDEQVEWNGFVKQEDLLDSFRAGDVFVFPSLREPYGNAVLEAMLSGLPVICCDYGGPSHIVDHHSGIRVPLGTLEEMSRGFASAVRAYLDAPELVASHGECAHQRAVNLFAWDILQKRMQTVYEFAARSGCK